MRILHIVPIISKDAAYGGPTRGTLRQAHELARRGHEVTVLALSPDVLGRRIELDGEVTVVQFPLARLPGHRFAGVYSIAALRWVRRWAQGFDVVHLHSGRELFPLLAMRVLRSRRVPYIVQTHGMLAARSSPVHRVYDALLTRPAMRFARAVLSLTRFETRELQTFVSASRVWPLVNGVEPIADEPPEVKSAGLRILFVSRIQERKRPGDLLDAVVRVRSEGIEVCVDFYGPDEGALSDLRHRIAEADAGSYARYMGALDYREVRGTLEKYHVFVLPSVNEPFPNSLLEAMASGLAVVCTDSCGLAPYILEAGAGIVTSPGSDGVVSALIRLTDPAIRSELGSRALSLVRQKFSMTAVGAALQDIYERAS